MPPVTVNGASINVSAFQTAFSGSAADLQNKATSIRLSLSYGDFRTTQRELAKISGDPNLTESQKQAVTILSDQVAQASVHATN